jgi:hypothetical protein
MMYFIPGLAATTTANVEARQNHDQRTTAIAVCVFVEDEAFGGALRRVTCDAIELVGGAVDASGRCPSPASRRFRASVFG